VQIDREGDDAEG